MRLVLVSLKDCAVQAFMAPQVVHHKQAMIRALSDGLKAGDNKADWARHPEDFELYKVGEFDDQTGCVESCQPEFIIRLSDLVVR